MTGWAHVELEFNNKRHQKWCKQLALLFSKFMSISKYYLYFRRIAVDINIHPFNMVNHCTIAY